MLAKLEPDSGSTSSRSEAGETQDQDLLQLASQEIWAKLGNLCPLRSFTCVLVRSANSQTPPSPAESKCGSIEARLSSPRPMVLNPDAH